MAWSTTRLMDTTGDGTGTTSVVADYSGGAVEFKIVPPADARITVRKLIVSIQDEGGFDAAGYGSGAVAATNGIKIQKKNAAGIHTQLLGGFAVTRNREWLSFSEAVTLTAWDGVGSPTSLSVVIDFESSGRAIQLDGSAGEYLAVIANDDFTVLGLGITDQKFTAIATEGEV